ncbi:MAG TPA: hypothetical protein VND93_33355 [Myxococcales bacterium]|nr:hypothetical protein [Myxococcales bacterium]
MLLFAVLARHKAERHVWLAIGSGSWDERDGRDCFCSVEAWVVDGKVACRATEGDESPFRREALFAQKVARLVRRDEVMDDPERKAWLFGWVDDLLLQVGALRDFVGPPVS